MSGALGGGGFYEHPSHLHKTTFPVEFPDKSCPIDRVRRTMIIIEKKVEKSVLFQNVGQFTDFRSA